MLLKALGASVGVFLVIVIYMAFAPAAQGVGLAMLNFPNACVNGTCVSQVASNAYFLFGVGVMMTLIFLGVYLFAAASQEEPDTGEFDF